MLWTGVYPTPNAISEDVWGTGRLYPFISEPSVQLVSNFELVVWVLPSTNLTSAVSDTHCDPTGRAEYTGQSLPPKIKLPK